MAAQGWWVGWEGWLSGLNNAFGPRFIMALFLFFVFETSLFPAFYSSFSFMFDFSGYDQRIISTVNVVIPCSLLELFFPSVLFRNRTWTKIKGM